MVTELILTVQYFIQNALFILQEQEKNVVVLVLFCQNLTLLTADCLTL